MPLNTADPVPDHPPPITLRTLRHLSSRKKETREIAEWVLQSAGEDAVPRVLELLQNEAARRYRKSRRYTLIFKAAMVVCVVTTLLPDGKNYWGATSVLKHVYYILITVAVLFSKTPYPPMRLFFTRAERNGARWLARSKDPRVLGVLLEAAALSKREYRDPAAVALVDLLPQVEARHASMLTDQQRVAMYSLLSLQDKPLLRAVLRALGVFKDTKAIPAVKSIIQSIRQSEGRNASLLAEAEQVLSDLEAVALQSRDSETLLRPAEPAGETLLRPVSATTSTPPDILLHPLPTDQPTTWQ